MEAVKVENNAELPLPFEPFSDHLPEQDFRMDWRYMDLRQDVSRAILRSNHTGACDAVLLAGHVFIKIHSPKIMGTQSESGASYLAPAF